jgi:hypothetical protein
VCAKKDHPKAIDQKKRAVRTRPFGREAAIVPQNARDASENSARTSVGGPQNEFR